jgi:chromosomal replication initiator protein
MEAVHWSHCLHTLAAELPEQQFNTWVRPLHAIQRPGALTLLAPNRFVVEWVCVRLVYYINGGCLCI